MYVQKVAGGTHRRIVAVRRSRQQQAELDRELAEWNALLDEQDRQHAEWREKARRTDNLLDWFAVGACFLAGLGTGITGLVSGKGAATAIGCFWIVAGLVFAALVVRKHRRNAR